MRNLFENGTREKLLLFALTLISVIRIHGQACDTLTPPVLFGQSQTFIYCKNISVGFGVSNSTSGQAYDFSVSKNGKVSSIKAGPLDGNGGQLSVAAFMQSSQDAGQYGVTTYNNCGDTGFVSFQAFYGSIDNLSITSWGSNAVTFKWAACGPIPAVTYDYAVTTESDPNSPLITFLTTTDTTASATGLISGTTYYIYVRVNSAIWNGQNVEQSFDCNGGDLPWETIQFVSCAGTAPLGPITPANAIACAGSTATLTATGGNTYQWYDDNNNPIAGANSPSYAASAPGQYKIFITTSAGCQGIVSTATFIQTSLLEGVFSGGGCFHLGDSVKLGISNTAIGETYEILKDGAHITSLQGIGNAFESTETIFYKFKFTSASQAGHYTVRASNPYCASIIFGDQAVSLPGTWTGAADQYWQNPLNWNCGSVPDATTDVVIPVAGVTHMPLVNNNVTCRSVVVQPGATLTVASGFKLNIIGK